jgi:hypothetical protein
MHCATSSFTKLGIAGQSFINLSPNFHPSSISPTNFHHIKLVYTSFEVILLTGTQMNTQTLRNTEEI